MLRPCFFRNGYLTFPFLTSQLRYQQFHSTTILEFKIERVFDYEQRAFEKKKKSKSRNDSKNIMQMQDVGKIKYVFSNHLLSKRGHNSISSHNTIAEVAAAYDKHHNTSTQSFSTQSFRKSEAQRQHSLSKQKTSYLLSKDFYNRIKLLMVSGNIHDAYEVANRIGLEHPSVEDLLHMDATQLNYMRRAYIRNFWRKNDEKGAHELFDDVKKNGCMNRKFKAVFEFEKRKYEKRKRKQQQQQQQQMNSTIVENDSTFSNTIDMKKSFRCKTKEMEMFEDLADEFIQKEEYIDTLKRKAVEKRHSERKISTVNTLENILLKSHHFEKATKEEDILLLNISDLIFIGDVDTASMYLSEYNNNDILTNSSKMYLNTLLQLDKGHMSYIRGTYLRHLATMSSHNHRNYYDGGYENDGVYNEGEYLMNQFLRHQVCTSNVLNVFLQYFASGSDEMKRWINRYINEQNNLPPKIDCYNTLIETLRIEGDEEGGTNILDIDMDKYNIKPNKFTWNILQNITNNQLTKKRSNRLMQLYKRNDALSYDSAEHLLFGHLIPNGVATTWHHNIVLSHMKDSHTMWNHVEKYMWGSGAQKHHYNANGINIGDGSIPDIATYSTLISRMRMEGDNHAIQIVLNGKGSSNKYPLPNDLQVHSDLLKKQNGVSKHNIQRMRTSYLQSCFMSVSPRKKVCGINLYSILASKNLLTSNDVHMRLLSCKGNLHEARIIAENDAIFKGAKQTNLSNQNTMKYVSLACRTITDINHNFLSDSKKNGSLDLDLYGHIIRQHLVEGNYEEAKTIWKVALKHKNSQKNKKKKYRNNMLKYPFGFYHAAPYDLSRINVENKHNLVQVEERRQRIKELDYERIEVLKTVNKNIGVNGVNKMLQKYRNNGVGDSLNQERWIMEIADSIE
jgi:hypothetical protein